MPPRVWFRARLVALAAGALLANGCLAALERNLDLILSPQSAISTLTSPYSGVSQFVQFFVRWFQGTG